MSEAMNVAGIFGENVFNEAVMKAPLLGIYKGGRDFWSQSNVDLISSPGSIREHSGLCTWWVGFD